MLFFMQPRQLQKKTGAKTSLELSLLRDTRTYSTLYNNAVHMHSRDMKIAFYIGHRQAQWEMRHNSFLTYSPALKAWFYFVLLITLPEI